MWAFHPLEGQVGSESEPGSNAGDETYVMDTLALTAGKGRRAAEFVFENHADVGATLQANWCLIPYYGTDLTLGVHEVNAMEALTISKAARQAGVGVETVRFYERQRLIEQPPKPTGSGVRTYSPDLVTRIRFIKEAQQIGFSLREIRELLTLRATASADCSDVREQAVAKLEEVRRKVDQLQQIGSALETLIAACPGCGGLQACSIMDALTQRSGGHLASDRARQDSKRPTRRSSR